MTTDKRRTLLIAFVLTVGAGLVVYGVLSGAEWASLAGGLLH